MTDKKIANLFILKLVYEIFVGICSIMSNKNIDFMLFKESLGWLLISSTSALVLYFSFFKINIYFKKAAVVQIAICLIEIVNFITTNIYENGVLQSAYVILNTGLGIALYTFYIKGIINIFERHSRAKYCQRWNKLLKIFIINMFTILLMKITSFFVGNEISQSLIFVLLGIIILLLGYICIVLEYIYLIQGIIYLKKQDVSAGKYSST